MFRKFSLLIICFIGVLSLQATPVQDLIHRSGNASDYPNDNLLVLFDSTRVDVQESGLSYYTLHQLTKILTPQGALRMKTVKYGYDPLSAFVEIQKVVVYRHDGSIQDIPVSAVMDYPAPARAIYWGAREKMIEVGRLEPGDAVEVFIFKKGFTYALLQNGDDDQYIPPMRGHFYDIVPFYSSDPVLCKSYQVYVPKDKTIQYEFYNGVCTSKVLFLGDKNLYAFAATNILPLKAEPNMVAWDDVAPKLLLSTSPDWKAKSLWFYNVNEDYHSFDPTPEVREKVSELVKDARTELDSISLLTHWVADNMRYSGISMGKGEGYTLHNCKMNFTDRCGVCKDKASMLIAMLRAAGFKAYPAMTMAGSRIDYIPADQFNHSVTVVKRRNGQYQLLDPTWVPFLRELWSSAEQQQNYLMGVPEGADLKVTPVSPPEDHYFRINTQSTLAGDGTLTGSFTLTAEGQSDGSVRGFFTRNFKSDWKKTIEKEFLRIFPSIILSNIDFGDPYDYMSGPIKITADFTIPGYALAGNNELIVKPITTTQLFASAMSYLWWNTDIDQRNYGFRDRTSRLVELEESITLPDGAVATSPFKSTEIKGTYNSGNFAWQQQGKTLKINQTSVFGKRVYDASDWPDFKKCVQAQKELGEKPFIIKTK